MPSFKSACVGIFLSAAATGANAATVGWAELTLKFRDEVFFDVTVDETRYRTDETGNLLRDEDGDAIIDETRTGVSLVPNLRQADNVYGLKGP